MRPSSPGGAGKLASAWVATFIRRTLAGQLLIICGDGQQTRDFVLINDLLCAARPAMSVTEAAPRLLGRRGEPRRLAAEVG